MVGPPREGGWAVLEGQVFGEGGRGTGSWGGGGGGARGSKGGVRKVR